MNAASLALLAALFANPRYALVVGHNVGDLNETPLRWAESDASRVKNVLTQIGGVAPERAKLLLSPTLDELKTAYAQMEGRLLESKARGERPVFVFYFSGHADSENLHLGPQLVPLRDLERALKNSPAITKVAIVDACRNDRAPRVKNKGAHRAPGFNWPTEGPDTPQGFVFLRSAAAGEVAQESDDLQGSLFTHHLLSGMRGSADFDDDGTVTLNELYRYGYSRTLQETHGGASAVQHSELQIDLSGRGALVMTYPRRAEAQLHFDRSIEGHLLLIDDLSGRIVAEVYQSAGQPSKLAVPPGKYRVQLRADGTVRSGLIALSNGARKLSRNELALRPTLAVLAKGAAYDPHPFVLTAGIAMGASFVEGFGVAPGLSLGFDYRMSASLRLVSSVDLGYAGAERELWRRRQLEGGVTVGLDWVSFAHEGFALTLGLRGGVAAVFQDGERIDKDRLSTARVRSAAIEERHTVLGPLATAVLGLEYYLSDQLGLRLTGEPSLSWLRTQGSRGLRISGAAALSLVVRL